MRQPPPAAARPVEGTSASQEEVRAEDDEILRQLQSTQARISIWSLLASSSTHRDALTRALSQIRVDTTTTPEGLIHMMTAGRATCIVFSDDDLPPEGSDHTRPLYISVGCSGRRVPSVLLDNGSALNVCPLATAIALGYAPSDFGPLLRPFASYDSTRRGHGYIGDRVADRAGAIPSSLHQKVKFIHDGQVVVVQSVGDMFIAAEPVLEISHTDDDLFLTGFTFDEHGSTVVLDIMRSMSYLPGMGLGRRQHGPSEFIAIPDHDHHPGGELQRLVQQLRLRDGAPGPSTSVLIAPSSPDRTSLMTLCFPDETDEHGTFAEVGDIVDGAAPHDEYIDEMLALSLSQIEETVHPGLASSFDLFGVSAIELAEESLTAPALESIFDIDDEIAQHDSDDDSSSVSDSDPVDQRVSPAVGDTEIVDFGTADQPRELRIGSDLSTDERDSLIQLLRAYWTSLHGPMRTCRALIHLSSSIVCHFCPMPDRGRVPGVAGQCRPCSQKDGKVRVCVDFRDLNKASPKDDFPLPHIDMLVDSTAGHSMLSFMDGFSGYSQILMAPEDMEKTSFITEWGTYCYRVMPFGLKNAGATYQRAATTLFHDMMHRDVEVYVDDMIVKSRGRSDHLAALERFFERIRQFRLRLNPKKCTFGVTSGKLLGYMVSERGIEVDPDKIRAILTCLHRGQRGGQRLPGQTSVHQQIHCQIDRHLEYLLSPPVLAPPTPGRPLLLYLSVSDVALGCMLAQLDDSGKDRAIYYLSKRMLDYETRYVMIERYCLALVWATRRLRHYMTEYSVHLISKSIRGSIVADHLASLPVSDARAIDDDFPDEDVAAVTSLSGWRMYFDGAANHSGYGIGRQLELGIRQMEVFGDSNLVLRQIQGEWKTRDNQFADALATLASMIDIPVDATVRPLLIESRSAPAYCCLIDDESQMMVCHGIMTYITF
ncbi:Retrovirus-related Pol polyprotein from transposon 17.6 [Vitis vinifera]|uniref:Retrovirus-related Pol polyprotein from transposon 17.6 n=1 Tax=Vitis vinifera TaxID=29760 RepID=A0A438F9Y8_VITVI|nr:Retrovirus-related Pol polyprotein from transposon 17.6 [Vitis vinifera]